MFIDFIKLIEVNDKNVRFAEYLIAFCNSFNKSNNTYLSYDTQRFWNCVFLCGNNKILSYLHDVVWPPSHDVNK